MEKLGAAARSRGLQVSLPGASGDVVSLYHAADVLLSTSDWEGTPNVVMEAMATGTPVVASRVGGVGELIHHGRTGFLYEPEDLPAAVSFLKLVLNSEHLSAEIGQGARALIQNERAVQGLDSVLCRLYHGLLREDSV